MRTYFKLYNKESQQISQVTLLLHCPDTARLVVLLSLTLQQWLLILSNQRGGWNKTIKKEPYNGGRSISFRQKGLSGKLLLFQEPGVLRSHWCLNSSWLIVHRRSQVIWTMSWPSKKEIWAQICSAAGLQCRDSFTSPNPYMVNKWYWKQTNLWWILTATSHLVSFFRWQMD